jgi:general secretion pathway protein H
MTSRVSARARSAAGFTLIEMIVVLAIIGLATALIGFGRTPLSPSTEARAAAQAISGALRSARSEAVMTDRTVWFVLDTAALTYRWGERPAEQLPRDLRLGMMTSRDQQITESVGRIRFDPDGGSSGGRVSIVGGNLIWQVGVDWISGRVSSVGKKP